MSRLKRRSTGLYSGSVAYLKLAGSAYQGSVPWRQRPVASSHMYMQHKVFIKKTNYNMNITIKHTLKGNYPIYPAVSGQPNKPKERPSYSPHRLSQWGVERFKRKKKKLKGRARLIRILGDIRTQNDP